MVGCRAGMADRDLAALGVRSALMCVRSQSRGKAMRFLRQRVFFQRLVLSLLQPFWPETCASGLARATVADLPTVLGPRARPRRFEPSASAGAQMEAPPCCLTKAAGRGDEAWDAPGVSPLSVSRSIPVGERPSQAAGRWGGWVRGPVIRPRLKVPPPFCPSRASSSGVATAPPRTLARATPQEAPDASGSGQFCGPALHGQGSQGSAPGRLFGRPLLPTESGWGEPFGRILCSGSSAIHRPRASSQQGCCASSPERCDPAGPASERHPTSDPGLQSGIGRSLSPPIDGDLR